jgi:hypothetical protein
MQAVPMSFNPKYWLNRPMLYESRNHIGTAQKIVHTINWNTSAISSVTLGYARGWRGAMRDLDDGTQVPLYEPIGGIESSPLNYRLLFGSK